MIRTKPRCAMVSTEVAIGISVTVVALFICLGLFGDNLSAMISKSGVNNTLGGNSSKTQYNSFDRDYSNSQVNVQIMGEQGLQMLRRKANNKAIELIEQEFSKSNPNGNSIAYLSTAVKILSGESHICTFMDKDSDQHCDKFGKYNYTTSLQGVYISVKSLPIDNKAKDITGEIKVTINPVVQSVLSAIIVPLNAKGESALSASVKYKYITDITDKLLSYLNPDVVLIRKINVYKSEKNYTNQNMILDLVELTGKLQTSLKIAYYERRNQSCFIICWDDPEGNPTITEGDYDAVKLWAKDYIMEQVPAIDINSITKSAILKNYIDLLSKKYETGNNDKTALSVFDDDYTQNPTSCDILKDGLSEIANKAGEKITLPVCKPGT